MKKSALLKLKAIFGTRKGKRHQEQYNSIKSSRSGSPEPSDGPSSVESFRPIQRTPTPSRLGPPPSPPVPTKPVAPAAPEPSGPLMPCAICGRTFVPQSLSKHVKICEKMTVKKRKTFDSSRQRREGTDLEQYLPKNFGLPENSPFLEKSPPNTAKATPKPKPQSVRTAIMKPTADLQKCPHCGRAFGVRAFERHVEWCADKAKILPAASAQAPPHISDAKQRLNARTQYKAPPVRTRRSSQTREKSSRSASVESSRGVSPPREFGDYKHPQSRASESGSSNDYHEESSPHIPVIRNSRSSQNKSSGDANIKARQARLAKDLSSTRLDENYDPFVCAARQMKELMSSDTNIPQKLQKASKESSRTLPSLKPTTRASTLNRTDNTKTIKDTINKTYQKTPTLNRMKSFGSTHNDNLSSSFGGRCSSFRLNRNEKKPSLNTTFTKSSKENIHSVEKPYFNRSTNLNRSFSSYNNSVYSTPKLKNKIPKLSTSMHHAFQRNTGSQPMKLEKIKKDDDKKDLVNLDAILSCDNSSMTDSNYIDPMLINENDNLPINVNTILNNPDIISSFESLLTTENLPPKFESFSTIKKNNTCRNVTNIESLKNEKNNNFHTETSTTPIISDLGAQYDKLMYSLDHSITSRTSGRDDDSLCEDFDLEEFMTSFDEEVNKQKSEKRTCSSTTRVVKQSELSDDVNDTPKILKSSSNGMIPVNKSMSLVFSSNNIVGDKLLPSSVKRSTSLLDSIQKKPAKIEPKIRHKTDQLEDDIMQSLKEFDKFYESQKNEKSHSNKDLNVNKRTYIDTVKRGSRKKIEQKNKCDITNGNHTPGGKISNDSAYSSLNRVSPSKLSLCNVKESNDTVLVEQPGGSDTSESHKEDRRSISSEEFLAMEKSTELEETLTRSDMHSSYNNVGHISCTEKRTSSRASTHRTSHRNIKEALSSSGSETSLSRVRRDQHSAPRLSRFCHECGSKFPDKAKFCIECGVKRLLV
ncbi:probable serine/threonine-protein kinase DDB_G0282963 isoform X1 [Pieris rapae]|uniref:probable serine/threonine-protein kinase DDB_G0282963 isoform X1 n=1 Tax=Pieris rapae TaxID=64459 RepID=UPI001E27F541|nr:probable serine/threonine-protein kinase DDB_G0282963 isoform X1 [Pieris rapae]